VYWATAISNTTALVAWVALPWFQR
jgi:hypothetical protein